MSDRAIPRSYRMMQGFGVHTFVFVTAEGKRTFFKAHWRPLLGVHGLAWDESNKLMGVDPDFHRRDLYEAISAGNFPEWEFGVQLIPEADEEKFDFDILDATKIVPEELVPIRWVGKMTLDRVPTDFFAEVEQVAFCTQNIVRGIDFSNDPLLQGRSFSYLDTQLSRLGSVNFNQLPINRPLHAPLNNQRDGHMQMNIHTDKLNYFPNRLSAQGKAPRPGNGGETQADLAERRREAFASYAASVEGMKVRTKAPKFLERFDQASLYYNSLTPVEQSHLLAAASFELSKVDDLGVRERMVALWNQVDHGLASQLAANIAVAAPSQPQHRNHGRASRFLSMVDSPYTPKDSCATRKVACLLADGYRAAEVAALQKALEAEGAVLVVVGSRKGKIYSEGMAVPPPGERPSGDPAKEQPDPSCRTVNAGFTFANSKSVLFDGLALVGGAHVAELQANGNCLAFVAETLKHCKAVCAAAEAVQLLHYPAGVAGLALAKPGEGEGTVVDDGVVTAAEPKADFVQQFVTALKQHRAWARKGVDKIPA